MSASVFEQERRPSAPARVLIRFIEAYQHVFAWRPSPCRFVPSCSSYALEAVESHGAWRGGGLAARRLLRCHPWGASGPDPVPTLHNPKRGGERALPEKEVA